MSKKTVSWSPRRRAACSRLITAPTLVSVSDSGMYQIQPSSNAAHRMLPESGAEMTTDASGYSTHLPPRIQSGLDDDFAPVTGSGAESH